MEGNTTPCLAYLAAAGRALSLLEGLICLQTLSTSWQGMFCLLFFKEKKKDRGSYAKYVSFWFRSRGRVLRESGINAYI